MSKQKDDFRSLPQAQRVVELAENIESMDSDDFMEGYNSLDAPHRRQMDRIIRDFANAAIGDDYF